MADEIVLWHAGSGAAWTANAGDGCRAALLAEDGPDGPALRFDFALAGHGGWAIARRDLTIDMPAHYVVVLRVRGTGAVHELQVKLVAAGGADVWWWRRPGFRAGEKAARIVLRRATLDFAWGPASGGDPGRLGAVEIAVASNETVAGSLWIDELRIVPRPAPSGDPRPVAVRASSARPGYEAAHLMGNDATPWHAASDDRAPWLEVDLGATVEWGGVVIDADDEAPAMRLLASDDGAHWATVAEAAASPAGRRWLRAADGDGRFARIAFLGPAPPVSRVEVVPIELAVSPARWVSARARRAPRGRFPRHLLDEQAYWAIAAADAAPHKALLGEHGALELDVEGCSLEPFLWLDGRLVTWADVEHRQSLADGHLPLPSVEWRVDETLALQVTAFAESSLLIARYALASTAPASRRVRLFLAVRPFQVNPSWQRLNLVGGVSPIHTLAAEGRTVRVNDARAIVAVSPPEGFGVAPTAVGLAALERGALPEQASVRDPLGFAEGAWAFDVVVPAGGTVPIAVAVPWETDAMPSPPSGNGEAAAAWVDERLAAATGSWRDRLGGVPIKLPPSAAPVGDTLRASLGWILVNRDGPRIQPGPRCYRRSWIRDGALTGMALAEMGFADEARAFLRWYAPHQLPDGRVPCAVNRDGVDPVPEHDSHGELIWGIVELWRLTGDRAVLDELWPHAHRAAEAIAALRAQRMTGDRRGQACWGLLPESISHEGYSSRPVHSFWDDFFAVRGLADAAEAAEAVGDVAAARRLTALRDDMRRDLHAAIRRTIADHGLSVIPGSVELGDFDPTSTAIAFDPCDEWLRLPQDALRATFARYLEELTARRNGTRVADAYTPYEVRTAAALVALGQRERALELLEWLIGDQRPVAWRQWPEIAWRDTRAPRFLGDLPHGWVASSFVRAVRRLVAWEDRDSRALALAAGVPAAWVREEPGIRVVDLPTHWGSISFAMVAPAADRVEVVLDAAGGWPPGGLRIHSPLEGPVREATGDGRPVPVALGVVRLDRPARLVVIRH
jgi:hypothetical protein